MMRRIMTAVLLGLHFVIFFSCENNESASKRAGTPTFNFLSGYWIPTEIKWGSEDLNSKDIGDIFRTSSFITLCFDTAGKFIYFNSTQRCPKGYGDSIIFAGEPIVKIYKGIWNFNDTLLNVSYKIIPIGSTSVDSVDRDERIKIVYSSKDTLLLFKNELYGRTHKYDKISQQTIESYKKGH